VLVIGHAVVATIHERQFRRAVTVLERAVDVLARFQAQVDRAARAAAEEEPR